MSAAPRESGRQWKASTREFTSRALRCSFTQAAKSRAHAIPSVTDADEQERLAELVLTGASNTELRRRIGELKDDKTTRRKKTERASVLVDGYTASVAGPAGRNASHYMKAAVESLLEKLDSDGLADAA